MKSLIFTLGHDDKGQDLIEYGLLVGIITIAVLVATNSIGLKVAKYFTDLDTLLP